MKTFASFALISAALLLAPPGRAAPDSGSPPASQTGPLPGSRALLKPDLLLYGCYKKVLTPDGTPPDQVMIELSLVIQNVGLATSRPTEVAILFTQAGKTLTYPIPKLPRGPYGSTSTTINGQTYWSGKNTYHLRKTITPYVDILPIDLSNGLTANVTLDPDDTVAERKEDNNTTPCDFSLGALGLAAQPAPGISGLVRDQ